MTAPDILAAELEEIREDGIDIIDNGYLDALEESASTLRDNGTEAVADGFDQDVTLKPHPHELTSAITSDHVVVFGYPDDGLQFEVSGETDHDDIEIDWTYVEIDRDEVRQMLDDGHVYRDSGEDVTGRTYEIHVRAGGRHPKGTPVHTQGGTE